MKTNRGRRPPIPMTPEDNHIWTRPKAYAYNSCWRLSRHQDRRDADLMLAFIRLPQLVASLRGFRPLARIAFHIVFDQEPL